MAHYIQLVPKNSQTNEPESFSAIDTKLCEHLNQPVHPENYYTPPGEFNWYDAIGWLCMNKSLVTFADELEKEENGLELAKAIRWIDDNYTLISWMGR
jgi:hypothetical protein